MKHKSFIDFLKEEVSSADVASVDTKLDLVDRKDTEEPTVESSTETDKAE